MPKNRQKKTAFPLSLMFTALLCITTFLTLFSLPKPKEILRPLAYLALPSEPRIYLPGPRVSTDVSQSVLGAETIDPRDVITFVNEERMKRGIRPLRVNETLMKAATMRAKVILKNQDFSHQDPVSHIQLDTVLPMLQYPFIYASENIGMGDFSGRAFVNGFMNSPSHRANLLDPALIETGTAIVSGPYKQYYVNLAVQLFAIPADRDTQLGYTKRDVEEYKKLLGDIGKQLVLTRKLREKDVANAEYYDQWERLLVRQQEIVATLSHVMQEEKPFARELIAMIKEYNANWATVPIN